MAARRPWFASGFVVARRFHTEEFLRIEGCWMAPSNKRDKEEEVLPHSVHTGTVGEMAGSSRLFRTWRGSGEPVSKVPP
jgi:hypothetical protein